MIYIKHIQLFLLASLLFALQPAMAIGSPDPIAFVTNHQEDFSLFKTKSSKALVLHETSTQTVEVLETFQVKTGGFSAEILSALSEKNRLPTFGTQNLDKKHLLTSQIFPFHFHF